VVGRPVTGGVVAGGPVTGASVSGSKDGESVVGAIVVGRPVTGGPVTGGPVIGGPVTGGPVTGGPVTGGSDAEVGESVGGNVGTDTLYSTGGMSCRSNISCCTCLLDSPSRLRMLSQRLLLLVVPRCSSSLGRSSFPASCSNGLSGLPSSCC